MKAILKKTAVFILLLGMITSCEDYLELDAPKEKIESSTLFQNDETAHSALVGLYNQLASVNFSGGGPSSLTVLNALSGDLLMPIYTRNQEYMQFEQHELLPLNFRNENLWTSAYNIIYITNALLEGIEGSDNLSEEVRDKIQGEASFIRAFTYFYLVNLYGDVPLILTTDYRENSLAERVPQEKVYQQILTDLETAISLLSSDNSTGDRTVVNKNTAVAMMARVQLYLENWNDAELYSSQIIDQTETFKLLEDLNSVFLANSKEAIWQISPESRGYSLTNTQEGGMFIIHPLYYFLAQFKFTPSFIDSFTTDDKRLSDWIGFHESTSFYFPFKYKIQNSTEDATEFSMVLRLAEQYLIRAEARARQNDLAGAISDLDKIRERAGLMAISQTYPEIGQEALLQMILEERKKELFTEWGHRWLDLKRTDKAGDIFVENWESTDVFYPIPENDRLKNPNLTQNEGY